MNFRKVNNITGWLVFAIAYVTYLLTMEATASLWDCGEFLSTAYKLEVGHSPGAPLFMMLGRLFGVLAPTPDKVAIFINSMSALMSGFTILFLFWTITHFAKKLLAKNDEELSSGNLIAVIGAGVVGALAYTFSDTFWFSAVEGEVYATSSFFTAIVFWAILKWEHVADEPHADRWLVLIFYLMGLSIGVHLLNLLTIPAIVMVYYFKRYEVTQRGSIIAFFVGCAVLGLVQFGIIQYLPIFASWFELLFVNSFGMPFNTGAIFFMAVLAAALAWLVIWSRRSNRHLVHVCTLSAIFLILGYSSYISIIVRSKADVPIDMGNPDNVMTLIPYLQRDQYGSMPLVSGPDFTSQVEKSEDGRAIYAAVTDADGKHSYQLVDHKVEYTYNETRLFPRVHDFNDAGHVQFYQNYLGLDPGERPSAIDNQKFFWGYQMNWMYWRYVMWNYSGRQNDMEGQGEAHNGNWITGISFLDKLLGRGDLDAMPESYRNNKARNQMYLLPLVLGFLGVAYQYKRHKKDAAIVILLFFFTGAAIVIYLNNTPMQPRERDYAYAGSTYAFAIWIGLGVLMVTDWLRKPLKGNMPALAATLICVLAVPVVMAAEEWDDHDRSQKTIARDHAYNMLMSCDKNAILLTFGDNDTYPLWYLQEIEGIRTDVRIINYNLLGTDWQNEQLTFKVNDADAIPTIWKPADYRGSKLAYIPCVKDERIPDGKYVDLEQVIQFFTNPNNARQFGGRQEKMTFIPSHNLLLKIDKAALIKSGQVSAADSASIPAELKWQFKGNIATRGDLALMNMIAGQAKTGWTRPIYITDGTPNLGLDAYFQSEGSLRKFVPVDKPQLMGGLAPFTDLDKNIKLFTKTFTMSGAKGNNIYYDEKNRMLFLVYRQNAAELALNLIGANRKADAIKVLDSYMAMVSETSMPFDVLLYDRSIMMLVDAYYRAGAVDKGHKIAEKMAKNIAAEVAYYRSLGGRSGGGNLYLVQQNLGVLNFLVSTANEFGDAAAAQQWQAQLKTLSAGIPSSRE